MNPYEPGAKLDANKPKAGILLEFSHALMAIAELGTYGVTKYSRGNWLFVPNATERYTDALIRHLLQENINHIDEESGFPHAVHTAWNALARLELMMRRA